MSDPKPVFSRPLKVDDVPESGLDLRLVADEAERAHIAAADDLVGLALFEAELHVARRGKAGVRVTGEVRARLTQTCVVTLEPFELDLREPIDIVYAPQTEAEEAQARAAAEIAAAHDKARRSPNSRTRRTPLSTAASIPAPSRRNFSRWRSIPGRASPAPSSPSPRRRGRTTTGFAFRNVAKIEAVNGASPHAPARFSAYVRAIRN